MSNKKPNQSNEVPEKAKKRLYHFEIKKPKKVIYTFTQVPGKKHTNKDNEDTRLQ